MEDAIAHGAIRRISVDVANLTGQLAVMQSGLEYVQQVAREVMPDTWDKIMGDDDTGHPEMQVTLRGEQVDAVMRLLAALGTLS
jgi:hypothetical protein